MTPVEQFLEQILGSSQKSSKGNRKYSCCFDGCKDRPSKLSGEFKLEIDVNGSEDEETGKILHRYHCWSCNTKGKTIYSLLKNIQAAKHLFEELNTVVKYSVHTSVEATDKEFTGLPKEYISLEGIIPKNNLPLRHAKAYLKKRGLTEDDIIKYNVGFCEHGTYNGRVIFPSYDNNMRVNYFSARTVHSEVFPKYKNPPASRDIVPYEMYINENEPIILCEGPLDMITIKRNVIPCLDKEIQDALIIKIIKAPTKKIYMALDPDALKQVVKYSEQLLAAGKQIFIVDMKGYKDAGEMGFVKFTESIQTAKRLTQSDLMKMKLNLLYE